MAARAQKPVDAGVGQPTSLDGYAEYGSFATSASFVPSPFWDNLEPLVDPEYPGGYHGYDGEMVSSNPWDRVSINGNLLPGIWKATATPALQLDVQKPNGYDGAALIEKGYMPASITLTGLLWLPMHWAEFQRQLPTFWRAPHKFAVQQKRINPNQIVPQRLALTIYAPSIAPLGLSSMVIYQITPPEETADLGVKQVKMMARQYVPQPQKRPTAVKKVHGIVAERGVIAASISANTQPRLGAFSANLKSPSVANLPQAPSVLQAGARPLKLPNFAGRT
jgi:hypothetical protein